MTIRGNESFYGWVKGDYLANHLFKKPTYSVYSDEYGDLFVYDDCGDRWYEDDLDKDLYE